MPMEKHSPGTHEVHDAITGRSAEKLIDRWANAVRAEVYSHIQNAGALTYQHQEKFRIQIKQQQGDLTLLEPNLGWMIYSVLFLSFLFTSSMFEFTAFKVGQRMNYDSNSTYRDNTWSFWYKHTHFVVIRVRKKQALQIIIGGKKEIIFNKSQGETTLSLLFGSNYRANRGVHILKKKKVFWVQNTVLNCWIVWGNVSFTSYMNAECFHFTIDCCWEQNMLIKGAKMSSIEGSDFRCCQQTSMISTEVLSIHQTLNTAADDKGIEVNF